MNLEQELKRLRQQVAAAVDPAEAMQEIKAVRQDEDAVTRRWFRSAQRELLAAERNGEWAWVEYTFPVKRHSWVLRWSAGQPATLWSIDSRAQRNPLNPGSEILQPVHEPLPDIEQARLAAVLSETPADLRDLVIRLAAERG